MGFDVVITAFAAGGSTTPAQVLEEVLGMDPVVARMTVRKFPCAVIQRTTRAHADSAAAQLREAGAQVDVVDRDPTTGVHAVVSAPEPSAAEAAKQAALELAKLSTTVEAVAGQPAQPTQPAQPEAPAQRQLFNTVALRSLEDDLSRVDLDALPNKSAVAKQPEPPSWDAPLDEAPMLNTGVHSRTSKQNLPDADDLFANPRTTGTRASLVKAEGLPTGGGLDDLFQAPGPAGAENYYKRTAEQAPQKNKGGSESKNRVFVPIFGGKAGHAYGQAASHDVAGQDLLTAGSEGAEAAAKGTLKTLLSKAAAGVAGLGLVAGTSMAVISTRDADAQGGTGSKATAVETQEARQEWLREKERAHLHPAIRYSPESLAPAFGSILRKRVDHVFHVGVEWEDGPEDLDCMFIATKDGKGEQRMTKLLRTGMQMVYPDDVKEQLKEHLESLRSARNDAKEEFKLLCLSVSAIEDLGKENPGEGDLEKMEESM